MKEQTGGVLHGIPIVLDQEVPKGSVCISASIVNGRVHRSYILEKTAKKLADMLRGSNTKSSLDYEKNISKNNFL